MAASFISTQRANALWLRFLLPFSPSYILSCLLGGASLKRSGYRPEFALELCMHLLYHAEMRQTWDRVFVSMNVPSGIKLVFLTSRTEFTLPTNPSSRRKGSTLVLNSSESWISKSSACCSKGMELVHSAKLLRFLSALSVRSSSQRCVLSGVGCDMVISQWSRNGRKGTALTLRYFGIVGGSEAQGRRQKNKVGCRKVNGGVC